MNTTARPSVGDRVKALMAGDVQFRAAVPLPEIAAAKSRPELNLAQIAAVVMEGYADRPALAQRATRLVTDSQTGRRSLELLDSFQSLTYRDLWSRARALAAAWHHEADRSLRADEFLCILAFAGIDFATVDLAAIHNGAVVVPVQTNAPLHQQAAIMQEVEPRWLACSLECLDNAVELVLTAWRPAGLLLFDYHPEADDEREVFEAAQARLAAAGMPQLLQTLPALCERGAALPPAPLHAAKNAEQRLCTIYYTSGSTGSPKGAMYPEHMVRAVWRVMSPLPFLYIHYMPMNHSFGRSGMFSTLGNGGLCCFTAKSDLSTLLDDIRLIRPTFMGIVPRICELIHQRFQAELARRTEGAAADVEGPRQALLAETRKDVLGGRLLSCSFGSAPLSPELRIFMEECLGFPLDDNYGATEVQGVLRNTRVTRPPVIDYKLDDVPELGYFKTDKPHPRGELWVKTSSIMLGYYKRPEATAAMFDPEGYYKTGDIMAEIGPDQLVYVDRRNNVLKLAQGEFVAIARLEALYTAGHPAIRQVYLYGTSERAYLLAVIVPNDAELVRLGIAGDGKAIKAALREAVQAVAQAEALNAYEVPRDFIVESEPFSTENGLLAGIGKYLRPNFKARYGERLEALYVDIAATQAGELQALRRTGRDAPVIETVARAVQATLGIEDIDATSDHTFADLGGDSLSALSCSTLLEEIFEIEVPVGVINHPTGGLRQVAQFIERALQGGGRPTVSSVHGPGATLLRAADLKLECFLDEATLEAGAKAAPASTEIRTVLLTGANGYLGRFLCLEWLERMAEVGGRVICIARGNDNESARQRVTEVFDSGDADLLKHFQTLAQRHLEVLAGDLSEFRLGLSAADWQRLAESVDLVMHPAALVNHVLPYSQLFGPNVVGTAELVRLALTHRIKRFANVSTVAVAMLDDKQLLDEDADVRVQGGERRINAERYANGYATSKWAGEVLLRDAHDRFRLPVSVFRSDMILAHTRWRGQLNIPDMFTRLMSSLVLTGLAPQSFYVGAARPHYDGLPVDFTAESISTLAAAAGDGYRTYHVVNPHDDGISLDTFIDWCIAAGHPIQRIAPYEEWIQRFETALRGLPEKQRQQSFLPLMQQMRKPMPAHAGATVSAQRFRDDVRRLGVVGGDIPHLGQHYIVKVLADLRHLSLI